MSITVAAGDSSVSSTSSLTYTKLGDVDTVDGPLSADAIRYYYDDLRQVIGVVGPDPDGGGSLLYRAVRTTFNEIGQPTSVERGHGHQPARYCAFHVLIPGEAGNGLRSVCEARSLAPNRRVHDSGTESVQLHESWLARLYCGPDESGDVRQSAIQCLHVGYGGLIWRRPYQS